MGVDLHLRRQQRRLPAAGQVYGQEQEVGDQREYQHSHHLDGGLATGQENQVQQHDHAQADERAQRQINRPIAGELFR